MQNNRGNVKKKRNAQMQILFMAQILNFMPICPIRKYSAQERARK